MSTTASGCFSSGGGTSSGGGGTSTTATATVTATASTGAPVCDLGKADCNTDGSDGCETDLNTAENCGQCGEHCASIHGTPGCFEGKCTIQCSPGFEDCDGDAATGCEVETDADVFNCGACGLKCGDDHASPTCVAAQCTLACSAGWGDCNMAPADGCETDLSTIDNCGACGAVCGGQAPVCISGSCQGCPPDVDEPDEFQQASCPPMAPAMRMLDPVDNVFPLQPGRTSLYAFTFTTDSDVDVHYFNVTDDLTPGNIAGFEFTLSNIPVGAIYEIETLYFCNAPGSSVAFIYNTPSQFCDVTDPTKTGFLNGCWWRCTNQASAPAFNEIFGVSCTDPATNSILDDSGIMQVKVRMLVPPPIPSCAAYTLNVHVFGI